MSDTVLSTSPETVNAVFRFVRAYPPAVAPAGPVLLLSFQNSELLFQETTFSPVTPSEYPADTVFLGWLDGVPCLVREEEPTEELLSGVERLGLRALYGRVEEEQYALIGYATQILRWRRTSRFCSACGSPMRDMPGTWGRECIGCGRSYYPPVSPAVLALVYNGDQVLLAQKPGWGKRYSILAGFVEPGESLEECAAREVYEEVGVEVTNLQYMGSQPWPFPHQIMIGFTCEYVRSVNCEANHLGEFRLDETELERAAWFRYDDLPELPPPLSLSRQIIDAWVKARTQ